MKTIAIASLILAVSFTAVSLSQFPHSPLAFVLMFVAASSIGVSLHHLDDSRDTAN
jgi:hypothetical protein